jgi:plastocyanin
VRIVPFLLVLLAARASAAAIEVTVVDLKGRPVPEAVAFLYKVPGKHKAPKEPAIMDQIDRMFVPHVLPVVAGAKVRFPNKDAIHHHVYSFSKEKKFDLPLYKGEPPQPVLLETPGVVKLGCNIHDWMLGYIVVLENPFFAVTGKDGKAVIENVKPGKYKLALWSGRRKEPVETTLQDVVVDKKTGAKAQFKLQFSRPYVAYKVDNSKYQ